MLLNLTQTKLPNIQNNNVPSPVTPNYLDRMFKTPPPLPPSTTAPHSMAVTIHTPPIVISDGNFTQSGLDRPTGYGYDKHIFMKGYYNDALSLPSLQQKGTRNQ